MKENHNEKNTISREKKHSNIYEQEELESTNPEDFMDLNIPGIKNEKKEIEKSKVIDEISQSKGDEIMSKKTVKKKRRKLNKKVVSIILLVIAVPMLAISIYEMVVYSVESNKTKKIIDDFSKNTEVKEYESDDAQIIESDEKPDTPYWNFIKMNLIDVDFTNLKKTNSDTVGWITVGGTNVNYPIVQTTDNDFYLTHAFDKSKNSAGWVFMDFRNDKNNYGNNTIIYAHNRKDKTMFGTLKQLLTNDWYNTVDNRVIKMSSENYNTLWQIYSVYTLETTNDYIQTVFTSNEDYQRFLDLVKGRSYRDFNTSVTTNDKTLTLSTCHGSTKKLVVHAKLIKIENKQ